MNTIKFHSARQALARVFERIPLGFVPELTAVSPDGQLFHCYPETVADSARFLERYGHLEAFIGADLVPIGGSEFFPWANAFRLEACMVRPEEKHSAQLAGAALLVAHVESCNWLSRTDHFFVHGPGALYIIFTHATLKDLERSVARLVREKVSIRVEQALNHESPVHFMVQPAWFFPAPRSLADLDLDLGALREVAS